MSTSYIQARTSKVITREEFIKTFGDALYLSDDDIAAGNITLQNAESIGVNTGSGYIWCYFHDDKLTGTEDFGRGNDQGQDVIVDRLGIDLICEHDDDYDYHNFPKDVDADKPDYVSPKDNWEVYIDGGWFHAFERKERWFIIADARKAEEFNGDFEAYLEVIRQEFN